MSQTNGTFVTIDNVPYYKIENAQNLTPFFIQVASSCDIWLFMSSNGGVTAGRKNAANNIFPYETDDKLHNAYESGNKTVIKVGDTFWQPFEQNGAVKFEITRNIYKGYYGDSVIMEEVNNDLGVTFSYKYESSEKYGIVKTTNLVNNNGSNVDVSVLDGLMNLLPYGVNEILQSTKSTLVDSYKASELGVSTLGVYSLTTQINDTPNPIEVLKANVVYTTLAGANVYLNPSIVKAFYDGNTDAISKECYGCKSSYFVLWNETLTPGINKTYKTIMDIGYDHMQLAEIEDFISSASFNVIDADITAGTAHLKNIVGQADGLQNTGDEVACAAHYLNTLYNVMRGGTFESAYDFSYDDFMKFVAFRNNAAANNTGLLEQVKSCKTIQELKDVTKDDVTMYRLALEYMPLSFSRRHGDPSRPWNKFNIALKDDNGDRVSSYEGNWRDIFQNWEALGLSFPCYYENMIAKFVNASTADGFNPYRINAQGIDWEKPEEDNPFGGYGYWGDHQIIYLLRLLKGLASHFPDQVDNFLSLENFTYANIPYTIKSYDEILKDSKDTILFDFDKDDAIEALAAQMGSDGKLIQKDGHVYTVSLTEKLLVPLLSKMSNLLVGGGIWMNTQRPEWNDANNAIVGIGLSMVTVYHVKSYLEFMKELFTERTGAFDISDEVIQWMDSLANVLAEYKGNYTGNEKAILDKMGYVFSDYRENLYVNEFKGKSAKSVTDILATIDGFIDAIDYTIDANKGDVYHTYNLITDTFDLEHLPAMLEGQSAIIGSGFLGAQEICGLLDTMNHELLEPSMGCHTLYPITKTTPFMKKNRLSSTTPLVDGITYEDKNGFKHFVSSITTSEALESALVGMDNEVAESLKVEFQQVFAHNKFTGRSQVMYKFEGIGCVYWHQNAKLALAVLEGVAKSHNSGEDADKIYDAYRTLMQGFIYRKTPLECNAIPIEPYSHTSFNKKSEQPGMTGQVKESVIMRRIELGVQVFDGQITFDKWFLNDAEYNADNEVVFTIYGIDTRYVKSDNANVSISYADGSAKEFDGGIVDKATSAEIFARGANIKAITIG